MKQQHEETISSPELKLEITAENYTRAVQASSGACLVADAIKEQYPKFSNVSVDAATIRFTDKEQGQRYIYLTPPSAWETLLAFDQGWSEPSLPKKLRIRNAVRIVPITRSASSVKKTAEERAARLTALEAKEQTGELTSDEQRSITKLRNPKEAAKRPKTYGPTKYEAMKHEDTGEEIVVVKGGVPMRHANLLHGLNRHFGAKKVQPSAVFKQAVDEAVKADRAKRKGKKS